MDKEDYQNPFFEITEKETKKSVKICFGNFLLDNFMRNFRRGSITDLIEKIFLKTYNGAKIEEEIKQFKNEVSEFAHYAKNNVYLAYGNGIRDDKALENTFKLDVYIGMAFQELSDVFLKIVARDKENKFSSEIERLKEVENEILKIMVKLANSILDLIYGEALPPENVLKRLEMPNIRKLKWLSMIICAGGNNEYCGKEAEFRIGEQRKYVIPANVDTGVTFQKGLNNKEGPQAVVGIKGAGETKLEKEFYLFGDFTSRRIEMLKKSIDKMFDKIVKQKDDPARLKLYEIELANLRDELVLIVFDIESEIKKIRRDYKWKLNFYGEYVLDENAIEVSKILYIKFIELLEEMRVLLLQYANEGIKVEGLIIGYLEKRIALREYITKEILKVDLLKCSVLDFIGGEIGKDKIGRFPIPETEDPRLNEALSRYIQKKEKLEEFVSEEIFRKGSIFDNLYVKFKEKGTETKTKTKTEAEYINPHDDFLFPGELEKHIRIIREMAEEKAKKEKDRNRAYKEACEEAIRGTVEECNYGEEMSFSEQLNRWKLNQKLLSPPDPKRAKKEWQKEVDKAKKEMPKDKVPAGEDINTDVPVFVPTIADEGGVVINYGGNGLKIGEKSFKARAESIHRIVVGIMENRGGLTASRYINFMAKLEDSEGTDEKEYAKKVIELVEKVKPTESEFQEYIKNITIDEIGRFLFMARKEIEWFLHVENSAAVQSLQEDESVKKLKREAFKKKLSEKLEKVATEMRKDIEKIKRIKSIFFSSLINKEDVESAIKSAKEELELK